MNPNADGQSDALPLLALQKCQYLRQDVVKGHGSLSPGKAPHLR